MFLLDGCSSDKSAGGLPLEGEQSMSMVAEALDAPLISVRRSAESVEESLVLAVVLARREGDGVPMAPRLPTNDSVLSLVIALRLGRFCFRCDDGVVLPSPTTPGIDNNPLACWAGGALPLDEALPKAGLDDGLKAARLLTDNCRRLGLSAAITGSADS